MLGRSLLLIGLLIAVPAKAACPNGWVSWGNYCYFFSTLVLKWDDARLSCEDREGWLATFNDPGERDTIGAVVHGNKINYWIGLTRESAEANWETWKWIDDSTPGPNDPSVENWWEGTARAYTCAQYRWNEPTWQDQSCTNQRQYICKRPNTVLDLCDYENDWHPYAKQCYKYFTGSASWHDAKLACEANRGTLAKLDTQEKQGVFNEVINCKDQNAGVWMGLSDRDYAAKQLHWVDGSTVSANNWDTDRGQPEYLEDNNNCVDAVTARSFKWQVDRCDDMNHFVCERPEGECAEGWTTYGTTGYCYQVVTPAEQQLTWVDARTRCSAYGGQLMKVTSDSEQDALTRIAAAVRQDDVQKLFIGVSDYQTDGTFRWADGSTIRYEMWDTNQPSNTQNRMDCGFVFTAGPTSLWRTEYCFAKGPYVCQIPRHTAPKTIEPPNTYECPEGWLNYRDECYGFVTEQKTYTEAKSACRAQQSEIVEIHSAEEQSFISNNMNGNSWIGLVHQGGRWQWDSTSEALGSFQNWHYDDGNVPSRQCVNILTMDQHKGAWKSKICSETAEYVCKKKAEGSTGTPIPPTPGFSPYCGPGWVFDASGDNCYKLRYDELVTWETAMTRCRDEGDGADLASVSTLGDHTFINALIHTAVGGAELYWIGLNDRDMERGWQWTDGSPAAAFFWNDGEPNNWNGDEWCVEIGVKWDSRWNDHRCEAARGFVCKKPSSRNAGVTTPAPPTEPPLECPADGEPLLSGSHYVQNEYMRSYYYMNQECGAREGISEPKRYPWNGRLDYAGEGDQSGSCPTHTTDGNYDYKTVINIEGWEYAIVQVMACQEVHVAFADNADILGENTNVYEWIIGGWENTRIAIRKCVHPCTEYKYTTVNCLMDCNNYRDFWFTWKDGEIAIGRGKHVGSDRLYRWFDPSDYVNVKHMGLTTRDYEGVWCLHQEFPMGRAGAWTPFPPDTPQELEIFLFWKYIIKSITTQGAPDREEWVTMYQFMYRLTDASFWDYYRDDDGNIMSFVGNNDKNSKKINTLTRTPLATYLRIRPVEYMGKVSMRIEINGCPYTADFCDFEEAMSGSPYIPDSMITASGFAAGFEPYKGRINSTGAWMAESPGTAGVDYLQIQFERLTDIHSIITKGRAGSGQFVRNYEFHYARSCWIYEVYQEPYGTKKVIPGNINDDTAVEYKLKTPVRALCIRIYPTEFQGAMTMRVGLNTVVCPAGCNVIPLITGDNHRIEDYQLSASSVWGTPDHGPQSSRLNLPRGNGYTGAWCAGDNDVENDWIQADLGYDIRIYAIATQGRDGYDQWITNYTFSYSYDASGDSFTEYKEDGIVKVFDGNFDNQFVRKHYLYNWHTVRRVRLHPKGYHKHMALRWEIYGCPGGFYSRRDIGCYADNNQGDGGTTNRDLPFGYVIDPPGGMTKELCTSHCFNLGYPYAGAQWARECFCGTSYGKYGTSNRCTMQCSGNPNPSSSNICGGENANTVMSTGLAPSYTRCADNYMEYNGVCWRFNTDKAATWYQARDMCRAEGGDLATVRNQHEMDFIMSQIPLCCENLWLWIGMHSSVNAFWFEWSDQEPVTYANWARREPNGLYKDEDCVHIYPFDGTWNDESCMKTYDYICSKPKEALPTPTPTIPDPSCPSGWYAYRWKCFGINNSNRDWDYQNTHCREFGGRLARVDDNLEQAFIQSQLAGINNKFWFDLSSKATAGTYMYTNGQRPSYTHWASSQPDRTSEPSCVSINATDLGGWYDSNCGDALGSVCEMDRQGWTAPITTPTIPSDGSCASGWTVYGNDCYKINDVEGPDRRTWDDALMDCTSQNAQLVSIHSADENNFIHEKIIVKESSFWLGATRPVDGGFQWSDGTTFEYANWADGEPNSDQQKSCVYMGYENGRWTTNLCASHMNWICKIPRGVSPVTTPMPTYPTAGPDGSCSPDDDRWKKFGDRCYFFSGTLGNEENPAAMTWYDAEGWCKQNGGYLASIHNPDQQAFIEGQIKSISAYDLWIGLNELGDGGYKWSDGTPFDYYNWAEGSPDDGEAQLCASIIGQYSATGKWRNKHCVQQFPFVCAKSQGASTIITQATSIRPGGCPEGYSVFESKCYRMYDEDVDWATARKRCRDQSNPMQTDLATISDIWDQSFITEMLLTKRKNQWIGLHEIENGQFVWADNTQVTYSNWAPREPNGGETRQCVELWQNGQWNDRGCQVEHGYVCQTWRSEQLPTPSMPPSGRCGELQGDKWILWNDDCYKLMSDQDRTWPEAQAHCETFTAGGRKANLASILNVYEDGFLHAYMGWYHDEFERNWNLWIGLSDAENPGRWVWSDHASVLYTNWGAGQPSYTTGSCVNLDYEHGGWDDYTCDYKMWSVCKHSLKDPTYTKPPSTGGCPPSSAGVDWYEYGDACYLFRKELKTFPDARLQCNIAGGDLTSIHSDEELTFIHDHMKGDLDFVHDIWIGLYRNLDRTFVWDDNTPFSYSNWEDGEPSDSDGVENCVEMYVYGGKWNDIVCDIKNSYVCKAYKDGATIVTQPPGISTDSTAMTTRITVTTNAPPTPLPTTPDQGRPNPPGGDSGMSPGGVVGLVFFLVFLVLGGGVIFIFVMRRMDRPIPFITKPSQDGGLENPTYGTSSETAINVGEEDSAAAGGAMGGDTEA